MYVLLCVFVCQIVGVCVASMKRKSHLCSDVLHHKTEQQYSIQLGKRRQCQCTRAYSWGTLSLLSSCVIANWISMERVHVQVSNGWCGVSI